MAMSKTEKKKANIQKLMDKPAKEYRQKGFKGTQKNSDATHRQNDYDAAEFLGENAVEGSKASELRKSRERQGRINKNRKIRKAKRIGMEEDQKKKAKSAFSKKKNPFGK